MKKLLNNPFLVTALVVNLYIIFMGSYSAAVMGSNEFEFSMYMRYLAIFLLIMGIYFIPIRKDYSHTHKIDFYKELKKIK